MARPEKPVDWNILDKLIEAQCPVEEIAGIFHMGTSTLRKKVVEKFEISFEHYSKDLYCKGRANLRLKQYQKAMEGNISMLLRLGDVYLGQTRVNEINVNESTEEKLDILISEIQEIRSENNSLNKAESSNNND